MLHLREMYICENSFYMNERAIWDLALDYNRRGDFPAAIVYGFFDHHRAFGKSGDVPPNLTRRLRRRLARLGRLGIDVIDGSTIGCCAEVHSANRLLRRFGYAQPEHIEFTPAYRPKTMLPIRPCQVCQNTFN